MTAQEKYERIANELRAQDWNVTRAASALGVHRQQLQRDLRSVGGLSVLRNAVESATSVASGSDVADATAVASATSEAIKLLLRATRSVHPALTSGDSGTIFKDVSSAVGPAQAFKTATIPLSFDEWLWLRRRGEQEAKGGGDASIRGAIRACIVAEMIREGEKSTE